MAKNKKRRWPKIVLCILIVLVLGVIGFGSNFLMDYAINRNASFTMSGSGPRVPVELNANQQWLVDISEDMYMQADGLNIHAFYVENPNFNGRYAVLCHGYAGNGFGVMGFVKRYYDQGYNLLIPDARSHGYSEGQYISMGWLERKDMVRWLEMLAAKDPTAPIILHGISMGGATVMMTSGEKLPSNVKAIIEDCGYTSVWDEFSWQMKRIFNLPDFPLLYCADILAKLRAGYSFREASAVEQVKKSVTPMLFIHGSADTFVPYAMLDVVYEAAACEKQKLVIEDAPHGASSSRDPALYWSTVDAFIEDHIR